MKLKVVMMIFVDMMGGLGNQLFQYATARSLALDKNSDFLMNLSDYEKEDAKSVDHVDFKLNHFNVDFDKQILEDEIKEYSNVQQVIEPLSSDNFAKFIPLNNYSGNVHLKGYWQDERYFRHNKDIIKEDLKVITPPNRKNEKMLDEISEVNSVCLSFRRGEYLDSYFIAQFGMCTEEYYKNAINLLTKKITNPSFFVFSDDVEWIEDNVKLDYPTIPIGFNGIGDEHEELRLMYSCNHFILANSSFSWWGAWLSDYNNKTVFAPTPWFNSYTKQSIVCSDWIQLNCDRSDLFDKSNLKLYELINKNDLDKLTCEGFETQIGKYGISIVSVEKESKIKFKLDDVNFYENDEILIEFKLFSKHKGLIKVDYGNVRKISLGYRKGFSNKYLHLKDINLNGLIIEVYDDSLIIENITIKSVDSEFDIIMG